MKQDLVAFWKYDTFPYCLWGIVEEFKGDKVYIKSYQGYFNAFLVVDFDHGMALINELSKLKTDRGIAMKIISDEYRDKLDGLIKIPGINT